MARAGQSKRRDARRRRQPQSAAAALEALVTGLGIAGTLRRYDVLTSWADLVGEQIARVTTPRRIEGGVLFVEVATAPWRHELTMRRREILARIRSRTGSDEVKDIRFR